MKSHVFLPAAVCFGLSATAVLAKPDFQIPVTSDFNPGEITWTGGHADAYVYVWDVIASDSTIAICGAGQFGDPTTSGPTKAMLHNSYVTMGGKKILTDMSFFARIKKSADLNAAKALCRDTGIAVPRKSQDIELVIPGGRARF